MDAVLAPLSLSALARLHRVSIQGPRDVIEFLRRLERHRIPLTSGINRRNDSRTARIQEVGASQITLLFENLDEKHLPQLFLICELEGHQYFFAVNPKEHDAGGVVRASLPNVIYETERRDLERISDVRLRSEDARVEIHGNDGRVFTGIVGDSSYHGLGILLPAAHDEPPSGEVSVRFLSGRRQGEQTNGSVRHCSRVDEHQGWVKIGLAVSNVPLGRPVAFERREQILSLSGVSRITHRASLIRGFVRAASARAVRRLGVSSSATLAPKVVEYESGPGENIRALVDSWGDPRGAVAVVIPNAWGRTKETLLPVAATIVETFRAAGQPITVVRFDGTHRRGESFIPSECRYKGGEYLRFTFSRAVTDIHATLEFLQNSPTLRPQRIILVTVSLAAIEGRRAVATDPTGLVAGWISVVGMADLQSALRTISGGIDFGFGLSRGLRFGRHELVGVVADMDYTGLDAIKHRLGFLEDARRDMAQIHVPITWIHGRHDGWMDVERVRHLMSCGDTRARRVIEVPTGHQLRTSAEAFAVFGLIATEVDRMTVGQSMRPAIPNMAVVDSRRRAERGRLPSEPVELRAFWTRYLLGRDARLGFELLTATSAYRGFMNEQIGALDVHASSRVLDLGSGTGDFAVHLATDHEISDVEIDAVDFVPEALERSAARITALQTGHRVKLNPIVVDFDLRPGASLPLRPASYDCALASLVISYVADPQRLLESVRTVLRRGGRLVVSALKRDADISTLHVEGLTELRAGRAEEQFGREAAESIDEMARNFLNEASRLLDLEEAGVFRFWDEGELATLVRASGFIVDRTLQALGDPPQATVLVAHRD